MLPRHCDCYSPSVVITNTHTAPLHTLSCCGFLRSPLCSLSRTRVGETTFFMVVVGLANNHHHKHDYTPIGVSDRWLCSSLHANHQHVNLYVCLSHLFQLDNLHFLCLSPFANQLSGRSAFHSSSPTSHFFLFVPLFFFVFLSEPPVPSSSLLPLSLCCSIHLSKHAWGI